MTAPALRWTGPIAALSAADRAELCSRAAARDPDRVARVAALIERVRLDGDTALRSLALELDGVSLDTLEVPRQRRQAALAALDPRVRAALERAARNIEAFHRAELPRALELEPEPGIRLGRRPDPLGAVGIYAPGGRAAYPSTVLMGGIPARVAGVAKVVLCSPPARPALDPAPEVLAAAEIAGIDRVFALGGAGAIAALAFGTATVPRVDRIVGPGNAWVVEAKLQIAGVCSIDCPAGPSELLVIADDGADADAVARELAAQAEHDPEACALAVVIGREAAARIAFAVTRAIPSVARLDVVVTAFASRGGVLEAVDLDEALAFAAVFAPEHLLLAVRSPAGVLPRVRNAGTVLLGESSSVTFGDYLTGANHTLPTGGLARSYSGLSALDFVRWTTWQQVTPGAASGLAADVECLARAEGLPGHAAAAAAWRRP